MSPYQGPDRRRAPRVPRQLPLTLTHQTGALSAVTRDISESGAYCTLRHHVPLMTRLQIRFDLPGRPRTIPIACQGVVVRVEPPIPSSSQSRYHVAIFFNEIADTDRARLAQYVHAHLRAAPQRRTPPTSRRGGGRHQ